MTKEEFLQGVDNWSNHRHLLWSALEHLKDFQMPVLELGCGAGSTPFLRKYCEDEGLQFCTYDSDPQWASKFQSIHVSDWNNIPWRREYSVVLIDESPGEHRKISLVDLRNNAQIVIIHDSEPKGWNASDYRVRELFPYYKYIYDFQSEEPGGAWATALSNYHNVARICK